MEGTMEDAFQIHSPKTVTSGDFVGFTIRDGEKTIAAQISRRALAVLHQDQGFEPLEAFETHKARIRQAAYMMVRRNSGLGPILLAENNFS
jgi:ribosomal protein S7